VSARRSCGAVSVTFRVGTTSATAVVVVKWKPASRVVPPRSASGGSRHARLALPVRQGYSMYGQLPSVPRRDGLCHRYLPGGLKGRGPVAANGVSAVASATTIRAGDAESADMSLSDRQRPEGFQRSPTSAVRPSDQVSSRIAPLEAPVSNTETGSTAAPVTPRRRARRSRGSVRPSPSRGRSGQRRHRHRPI